MRPTFIKVKTQQIDNENYVLITQEEYTKLRQRIDDAQEKDNIINNLLLELNQYKTFFENFKNLVDKQ